MSPASTEWWWLPTVEIADNQPAVQELDKDWMKIGDAGWPTINDGFAKTRIKNTGGKGQSSPPGPEETLTSGYAVLPGDSDYGKPVAEQTWPRTFDAQTASNVGNKPGVRFIAVMYQIDSDANRTADNARVDNWRFYLKSTMESSVN